MKKLTTLIGLKKSEFDLFVNQKGVESQINLRPARLIPAIKTGDEMALTSIFLSSLRLMKGFRDILFRELRLSRNGRVFFYTEVSFPKIAFGNFTNGLYFLKLENGNTIKFIKN